MPHLHITHVFLQPLSVNTSPGSGQLPFILGLATPLEGRLLTQVSGLRGRELLGLLGEGAVNREARLILVSGTPQELSGVFWK